MTAFRRQTPHMPARLSLCSGWVQRTPDDLVLRTSNKYVTRPDVVSRTKKTSATRSGASPFTIHYPLSTCPQHRRPKGAAMAYFIRERNTRPPQTLDGLPTARAAEQTAFAAIPSSIIAGARNADCDFGRALARNAKVLACSTKTEGETGLPKALDYSPPSKPDASAFGAVSLWRCAGG
jgi:hypothetical protein